jgi:hypothetical protein
VVLFESDGISPRQVLPWNACPWYLFTPNREERARVAHQEATFLGVGDLVRG